MRTIVKISFCFLFLFTTVIINAQNILNGSFENWTTVNLYNEPDSFVTTNMQTYFSLGVSNVTKSTDYYTGSYAARLETMATSNDTIFGGMFIGVPGSGGISGGRPYNNRPDSVYGYVKYDIMPNDSAIFAVIFKKSGTIIATAVKYFINTQNTYIRFSVPVTWMVPVIMPDTMAVIISSSNLNSNKIPGSYLIIDNINFKGTSVAPFPFGDLENWQAVSTEEPDDWTTINYANVYDTNYSSTKSTDSYSGNYSLLLKNVVTIWGDTAGYITNGIMGSNGPAGGKPITFNPDTFTFFYKYIPVGLDTALVIATSSRYDTALHTTIPIEQYVLKLPAKNIYTKVQIPFTYNGYPYADTINISYASGNVMDSTAFVGLGSELYIDSLSLSYKSFTDLAVVEPIGNFNFCSGLTNSQISILIKNTGSDLIPTGQVIDVYYQIDANPLVSEHDTLTSDFYSNDTIFYTFLQTVDLSSMGLHTYKFYINYPSDTLNMNDTSSGVANHTIPLTVNIAGTDTILISGSNFPDTLKLTSSYFTYFWRNTSNGPIISTDSELVINSYGWYYVYADNGYDCNATDSVFIDSPVKINNLTNNNLNIKIYPNPSDGNFNIIFDDIIMHDAVIEIFDIQGKSLYKNSININTKSIDISNFSKGIYFLKVRTNNEVKVEKIILE